MTKGNRFLCTNLLLLYQVQSKSKHNENSRVQVTISLSSLCMRTAELRPCTSNTWTNFLKGKLDKARSSLTKRTCKYLRPKDEYIHLRKTCREFLRRRWNHFNLHEKISSKKHILQAVWWCHFHEFLKCFEENTEVCFDLGERGKFKFRKCLFWYCEKKFHEKYICKRWSCFYDFFMFSRKNTDFKARQIQIYANVLLWFRGIILQKRRVTWLSWKISGVHNIFWLVMKKF